MLRSMVPGMLYTPPATRVGPSTVLESPGERPRRARRDCGRESTPPYRIRRFPGGGERSWTASGGSSTVVGAGGKRGSVRPATGVRSTVARSARKWPAESKRGRLAVATGPPRPGVWATRAGKATSGGGGRWLAELLPGPSRSAVSRRKVRRIPRPSLPHRGAKPLPRRHVPRIRRPNLLSRQPLTI